VSRFLRALMVDASLLRRRRDFRLLMMGQVVSLLGSTVTLVAIPFQVYALTDSTLAVGLLGLVEFLPIVVLALVGGALADAFDRRRLMIFSDAGSLLVALVLMANALSGDPQVWGVKEGVAFARSRRSSASACRGSCGWRWSSSRWPAGRMRSAGSSARRSGTSRSRTRCAAGWPASR